MAKIYGTLERAALETITSEPSVGITGRLWWNSTLGQARLDDGTNIRSILRNDAKAVIGNHASAVNNTRLHRGASGVLQFVAGSDATAEGTLSTSLSQISARLESYTDVGKPAFGNAGRVIWTTDLLQLQVDTGSAWLVQPSSGTASRVNALYTWVLGSAAQVTAGTATHSTWASLIAAASSGDSVKVLVGTWTESVSITKTLYIEGSGYGSNLTGTVTFTGANRCLLAGIRASGDITLDSSSTLNSVRDVWLASGKTFVDNGTGNLLSGFQET